MFHDCLKLVLMTPKEIIEVRTSEKFGCLVISTDYLEFLSTNTAVEGKEACDVCKDVASVR